jgi:hypothetical protein
MTTMTLDLPSELYQQLQEEATRVGRPVEDLVTAWLQERLAPPKDERERTIAVLRAAGMLAEPSTEMKARAAKATMSLVEVQAALDRAGGKPLSELIIEQRGLKG